MDQLHVLEEFRLNVQERHSTDHQWAEQLMVDPVD